MMNKQQLTTRLFLSAISILVGVSSSSATVFDVDLSPGVGHALNTGATLYTQDHAVGLSGQNTPGMVFPSGTGNEIGAGISYDDVLNQLTFDFAYGAGYGFIDLVAPATALHVHGPGSVNFPAPNTSAGVQFNLGGFHILFSPVSGRITGSRILSVAQEAMLFDNQLYVNIHSAAHPGGELRAQLIVLDPRVVTTTADSGPGSLRDAIASVSPGDTITFDNALGGDTITLTNGQLVIDKDLTVDASGVGGITIDGYGSVTTNRIFEIDPGFTVQFDHLTLINGLSSGDGGAVYVNVGASLALNHSTISGNKADFAGGIMNQGSLSLNNSTLSGNSADQTGGGIYNNGTLILNNATVSENYATWSGGIYSVGIITLNSSTLSGNSATIAGGGGTFHDSGTAYSTNSIIAPNEAPDSPNYAGNLDSAINCLTNGMPLLAPLGDYGGPTQTMPPLAGSPAIDTGTNSVLITDQRGAPRFDGMPDIGAVESQSAVRNISDTGAGSLRDAILWAPSGDTVTFIDSLAGQTITNLAGHLHVKKDLTIDASSLTSPITIDGNGSVTSNRVFLIAANTTTAFNSLVLTNGSATHPSQVNRGGAIYVNSGSDITLSNLIIAENYASNSGGGIYVEQNCTVTLENSTFSGNSANFGGAISLKSGAMLTLNNSTITGNMADYGGGIYSTGSFTINHSTISENTSDYGGAILNQNGILNLSNSTLSDNTAFLGGGINNAGTLTISQSTFAGNTASANGGAIHNQAIGILSINGSTLSYNGDGTGAGGICNLNGTVALTNSIVAGNVGLNISGPSTGIYNLTNGIPLLAPLGDYGGPTQTMPPLLGSPAINTGLTSAANNLTDQRGFVRVLGNDVDIGAVEFVPSILVTTTADTGVGSLRQAIIDATSGNTIIFTNTLAGQTILLTSGQLLIDKNMDIDASAINGITIDGNANGRIFEIASAVTNLFDSLILTNGLASGSSPNNQGGGINVGSGSMLTLKNSILTGNSAHIGGGLLNRGILTVEHSTLSANMASLSGGGLFNTSTGVLLVKHSTFSDNTAGWEGGGLLIWGINILKNVTISGNTAPFSGGLANEGTLVLESATISSNTASSRGGGINNYSTMTSTNSIMAGNTAPTNPNIFGVLASNVNNLTSGAPLLAPLGDYGGPTRTMPPLPGSPAINSGGSTSFISDQRGFSRVVGTSIDIGAVEYDLGTFPLIVDTVMDENDTLTNGVSLREAIAFGSGFPGATVTFSPSLSGQTIILTNGQLIINNTELNIHAPLPGGIVVSAANNSRVINIENNAIVGLSNLTIRNGNASGQGGTLVFPDIDGGGGILNSYSTLCLTNCLLTENRAEYGAAIGNGGGTNMIVGCTFSNNIASQRGGALYNTAGILGQDQRQAFVKVSNSVFQENSADLSGGAIYLDGADLEIVRSSFYNNSSRSGGGVSAEVGGIGALFKVDINIYQSTFFNNISSVAGGAIFTRSRNTTINNSTLSGNSAGIYNNSSTMHLTNSVVAGNTGGVNITGSFSGLNNFTSGNPLLAPLGDYGGPTQTMPPLPGSPAIDAGAATSLSTDQRGLTRVVNGTVDIGAVEYQGASDNALFWMTDYDGDGNAFGVEYALGTDWFTIDGNSAANLTALAAGGAAFGFNPDAANSTAWILKRSLDLVSDPFIEVYRYDGPTDTTTTNILVTVNTTATGIEVQDHSGATNAYYQFSAEPSP